VGGGEFTTSGYCCLPIVRAFTPHCPPPTTHRSRELAPRRRPSPLPRGVRRAPCLRGARAVCRGCADAAVRQGRSARTAVGGTREELRDFPTPRAAAGAAARRHRSDGDAPRARSRRGEWL